MEFTTTHPGRLDVLIAAQDGKLSRVKIQKAIHDGFVSVNDKIVTKPSLQVPIDSRIRIEGGRSPIPDHPSAIESINQHLTVLYEDSSCMVIDKPAGISVHPGHAADPDEPTLLSGIRFLFEERSLPFSPQSVLVHRLDKPTTGCICVAKSDAAFQHLQKQFEGRTVGKTYLAIVAGVPEHSEADIDAPIGRNLTDRTKMSVLRTSVSRNAKTSYRVVDAADNCALLECDLHTGRTHQIRVHLSSIGHPVLGDDSYKSGMSNQTADRYGISGLCLHAWTLKFVSPEDDKEHSVRAPLPSQFNQALAATGLSMPTD